MNRFDQTLDEYETLFLAVGLLIIFLYWIYTMPNQPPPTQKSTSPASLEAQHKGIIHG